MPASTNFLAAARLLIQLHELIAEGEGDSDRADLVRDQIDVPGGHLTGAERRLFQELSVDLYQLVNAPGYPKPSTALLIERGRLWGSLGLPEVARRFALAVLWPNLTSVVMSASGQTAELSVKFPTGRRRPRASRRGQSTVRWSSHSASDPSPEVTIGLADKQSSLVAAG